MSITTKKPFEFKYCRTCITPNTRPGIVFHEDGECAACKNFKKQSTTDWDARWKELEKLADKYRGKNGNGYDCAIAASSGKDSMFIVETVKNKLGLSPLILSLGNIDWTLTGRHNLLNMSDVYSVDILTMQPNVSVTRRLSRAAFIEQGKPTTYWDTMAYGWVFQMAKKLNLKLLFWGENVGFSYSGDEEETPSGKNMYANKVATPEFEKWIKNGLVTAKEVESARMMTAEECDAAGLEPVYLQWYTGWDSYRNYLMARRSGWRHLADEKIRSSTMEQWNQIDTLSYLINDWMRYPRFGHGAATQIGSRLIRGGYATREEIIKEAKEHDKELDQDVAKAFMDFIEMKPKEFQATIDKWYNTDLFWQDKWGLWHEKFEVGVGMKPEWQNK